MRSFISIVVGLVLANAARIGLADDAKEQLRDLLREAPPYNMSEGGHLSLQFDFDWRQATGLETPRHFHSTWQFEEDRAAAQFRSVQGLPYWQLAAGHSWQLSLPRPEWTRLRSFGFMFDLNLDSSKVHMAQFSSNWQKTDVRLDLSRVIETLLPESKNVTFDDRRRRYAFTSERGSRSELLLNPQCQFDPLAPPFSRVTLWGHLGDIVSIHRLTVNSIPLRSVGAFRFDPFAGAPVEDVKFDSNEEMQTFIQSFTGPAEWNDAMRGMSRRLQDACAVNVQPSGIFPLSDSDKGDVGIRLRRLAQFLRDNVAVPVSVENWRDQQIVFPEYDRESAAYRTEVLCEPDQLRTLYAFLEGVAADVQAALPDRLLALDLLEEIGVRYDSELPAKLGGRLNEEQNPDILAAWSAVQAGWRRVTQEDVDRMAAAAAAENRSPKARRACIEGLAHIDELSLVAESDIASIVATLDEAPEHESQRFFHRLCIDPAGQRFILKHILSTDRHPWQGPAGAALAGRLEWDGDSDEAEFVNSVLSRTRSLALDERLAPRSRRQLALSSAQGEDGEEFVARFIEQNHDSPEAPLRAAVLNLASRFDLTDACIALLPRAVTADDETVRLTASMVLHSRADDELTEEERALVLKQIAALLTDKTEIVVTGGLRALLKLQFHGTPAPPDLLPRLAAMARQDGSTTIALLATFNLSKALGDPLGADYPVTPAGDSESDLRVYLWREKGAAFRSRLLAWHSSANR